MQPNNYFVWVAMFGDRLLCSTSFRPDFLWLARARLAARLFCYYLSVLPVFLVTNIFPNSSQFLWQTWAGLTRCPFRTHGPGSLLCALDFVKGWPAACWLSLKAADALCFLSDKLIGPFLSVQVSAKMSYICKLERQQKYQTDVPCVIHRHC